MVFAAILVRRQAQVQADEWERTGFQRGQNFYPLTQRLNGDRARLCHIPRWCKRNAYALSCAVGHLDRPRARDRKSTRLNSSHSQISYAVFCLKKKIETVYQITFPITLLHENRTLAPPNICNHADL